MDGKSSKSIEAIESKIEALTEITERMEMNASNGFSKSIESIESKIEALTEITERMELKATDDLELLNAIKIAIDGMAQIDLTGIFVSVGPKFPVLLGVKKEDLIGKNIKDFVHPDYNTQYDAALLQLMKGGMGVAVIGMFRPDRTMFYAQISIIRHFTPEGCVKNLFLLFKNVPEENLWNPLPHQNL